MNLLPFLQRLHIVQPFVVAVLLEQFFVLATLYNSAFVEYIDAVGILDGGEAVCDGYRGAGLHEAFQSLLHQTFAFGIEGGGRFV